MVLHSEAFAPGAEIPSTYTCDGSDTAPPLSWSAIPAGARSLVLIVDDPDAPGGTWVHWIVYNLPPAAKNLAPGGALPKGALQGRNGWRKTAYGGPCPPSGRHRYSHRLYALDTVLPDLQGPSKATLEQAMEGHVLAQAELIGTYQRKR
ncbi:MAG TPA: YbhB/YbcL family Raf kinase inhibitor-like protein [Candidatus Polarisedimenticolaceae bacterium]|nr:YbhB/YbcL family Raf kinase inhibitor-like protein [Candidatus Polarisedimenticolaceae bacterium]